MATEPSVQNPSGTFGTSSDPWQPRSPTTEQVTLQLNILDEKLNSHESDLAVTLQGYQVLRQEIKDASTIGSDLFKNFQEQLAARLQNHEGTQKTFRECFTQLGLNVIGLCQEVEKLQRRPTQDDAINKLAEVLKGVVPDKTRSHYPNPAENKRFLALPTLGSKREVFQDWNEKFINAITGMTHHPTEFKYLFRQLNIVWASPPQAMKSELDHGAVKG